MEISDRLKRLSDIPLLSLGKHFFNPFFLILCHAPSLAFLLDGEQWRLTLLLFVLSKPCVIYSHYITISSSSLSKSLYISYSVTNQSEIYYIV